MNVVLVSSPCSVFPVQTVIMLLSPLRSSPAGYFSALLVFWCMSASHASKTIAQATVCFPQPSWLITWTKSILNCIVFEFSNAVHGQFDMVFVDPLTVLLLLLSMLTMTTLLFAYVQKYNAPIFIVLYKLLLAGQLHCVCDQIWFSQGSPSKRAAVLNAEEGDSGDWTVTPHFAPYYRAAAWPFG